MKQIENIKHLTFNNELDLAQGFYFTLRTELDAYRAAFKYRNDPMDVDVAQLGTHTWGVKVIPVKPTEMS